VDHIPETELSMFAFDPDAVPEERRTAILRHTASCASCRRTLDFFMMAEEDLADPDVWERVAGSATHDALIAWGERIAAEDSEAEALLAPLLSSPATTAWMNLAQRKRFRTGGVVRRLSAHAHNVFEDEPLDALTFADAAISIAEVLPDEIYPANGVYELRGTAWKERANAQLLLGQCAAALDSLDRAERAYAKLRSPSLGLATVALVRASVLYQQQRLEEAAAMAEKAERGFSHLGDDDRRMTALYLRASIKFEAQQIDEAVALFNQLLEYGENTQNAVWIGRASYALGDCEVCRGDLGEASIRFQQALAILRTSGPSTDRVRTEWGIARVLLHGGKYAEAIRRLQDVVGEFEKRGMVTDAALAGLDMAEAFLALGKRKEIVALATRLFRVFADAGMLTGALTAIAYIKEAAAAATLSTSDLAAVRTFLRRAEHQPDLLFVPPPRNS